VDYPATSGQTARSTRRTKAVTPILERQKPASAILACAQSSERAARLFASVRTSLNKKGLYQYSIFKQADVLSANGVGGGSLIYSNVTLQPKTEVLAGLGLNLSQAHFDAATDWITHHRGKLNYIVTKIPLPNHNKAELANLTGNDDYLYLDRTRELKNVAANLALAAKLGIGVNDVKWEPLDLAVVEYEQDAAHHATGDAKKNHTHCERQGRCFLGCMPAARNTLNKTIYSKMLAEHLSVSANVTLLPQCKVLHFGRLNDGRFAVTYRDDRDGEKKKVAEATQLYLGAGVMGTTEIMLRSNGRGMSFSDKVGHHFSTNGDFAGFAVNTPHPVYSTRGPINTCHISVKMGGGQITVEDCAVPEMFAALTKTALQVLDNAAKSKELSKHMQLSFPFEVPTLDKFIPNLSNPESFQTEAEMVANTLFFNAMGQDDASGRLRIDSFDNITLDWDKKLADLPIFTNIEKVLRAMTEAMGPQVRYVPFPLWKGLADRKIVVVHPLGGCRIGANNNKGVVDEFGRVYDRNQGAGATGVIPNLYIVDGSVVPGALAANPTMTITAQAVKSVNAALP
jgi:choline dehydrogenase-like flavoprotein